MLASSSGSVAVAVVVENWSSLSLLRPSFTPEYGVQSTKLPVVKVTQILTLKYWRQVGPGMVELAVLRQSKAGTGVSGVLRWRLEDSDTVLR